MMTRASFRLFPTGLIGSLIVALAAGGHLAGGGRLPELAIVTALCAVAMVPVAVLTRFRLSFPVLAGLLGAGQLLAALVLQRPVGRCPPATGARRGGRFGAGHPGPCRPPAVPAEGLDASLAVTGARLVPGALVPGAGMDAAMVAAHAAATMIPFLAAGPRGTGPGRAGRHVSDP